MNYSVWKQNMHKRAAFLSLADVAGAAGDLSSNAAVLLIASLAGMGGAAGWAAAKMNAHDKQDIDTIQKE